MSHRATSAQLFFRCCDRKSLANIPQISAAGRYHSKAGTQTPDSDFRPTLTQTPAQLVAFIRKNVVWISDDYIASVKPYDVSAYGVPWSDLRRQLQHRTKDNNRAPFDDWEDNSNYDDEDGDHNGDKNCLTVTSVLPELAKCFGGGGGDGELAIAKTVPRYYQGPLLLARNEQARYAANKSLKSRKPFPSYRMKSLCVCVGKPKNIEGEGWCYSKMEFTESNGFIATLHPTPPSKTAAIRGRMGKSYFHYRLLAYDAEADCSLLELDMEKMHQLDRLFLLDQGCPILGDALHQKCNARILGQPVYVPHARASIRNQYIPTGLLKKLRISLKDYHDLPLFSHVHSVFMPRLLRGSQKGVREDVELRAPMPSYFVSLLRAMDWLGVVEEDEKRMKQQEASYPVSGGGEA